MLEAILLMLLTAITAGWVVAIIAMLAVLFGIVTCDKDIL